MAYFPSNLFVQMTSSVVTGMIGKNPLHSLSFCRVVARCTFYVLSSIDNLPAIQLHSSKNRHGFVPMPILVFGQSFVQTCLGSIGGGMLVAHSHPCTIGTFILDFSPKWLGSECDVLQRESNRAMCAAIQLLSFAASPSFRMVDLVLDSSTQPG